ncbi:hypothetical protein BDV25DRAFT_142714 [Aspergillus avenaceus]|uniref:Uncharacterized protein n=1 Tax=Aspergillus avenaceus TaxID=36643 RepID=A0A5N6TM87_ASPAV|nr:hypothetical protein BDV25DRAFT_142714 [Aspergillus avenaceus]
MNHAAELRNGSKENTPRDNPQQDPEAQSDIDQTIRDFLDRGIDATRAQPESRATYDPLFEEEPQQDQIWVWILVNVNTPLNLHETVIFCIGYISQRILAEGPDGTNLQNPWWGETATDQKQMVFRLSFPHRRFNARSSEVLRFLTAVLDSATSGIDDSKRLPLVIRAAECEVVVYEYGTVKEGDLALASGSVVEISQPVAVPDEVCGFHGLYVHDSKYHDQP